MDEQAAALTVESHATTERWRFTEGDRVQRLQDVFDQTSRLMRGTVVACYSDYANRFGPYPELYGVLWDRGGYREGYLRHGLDPEAIDQTSEDSAIKA